MMKPFLLKDIKKIYGHDAPGASPLSIWIRDGLIEAIAPVHEIETRAGEAFQDAEVLDASGWIVMPGLVDSHTHLLFAGSRENELYLRAEGRPYMDILKSGGGIYHTVNAVRKASEEELMRHGLKYLDRALGFGITTIEIKSGYGLDFEGEEKMLAVIHRLNDLHAVDVVPTYLVHTVPKDMDRKRYIDLVAEKMIPAFRRYADWFDIFLEKDVFDAREAERLTQRALDQGYCVGMHTNQMNDIGGVPLADALGVRHVDHLEILTDEDARRIVANENLFPVFLPAAEAFVFSKHVGQIRKVLDIPDRIVLSTDFNPGSSPVLDPYFVMAMAVLRYRISDPFLLIDAFTANPAAMLGLADRGVIREGACADLVCLGLENFEQIPYFSTLPSVEKVMKNGIPINPSP